MTAAELLVHLRMMDAVLSVNGERLDCNAPAGVLTAELRAAIGANKQALISLLRDPAPAAGEAVAPLSFAQERMWVLDRLQGATAAYNIPGAVRLHGHLDTEALKRAVNDVVQRHAILRTTYELRDGEPVQIVHPSVQVTLPVDDLSALDADAQRAAVAATTRREASEPFDLSKGPLFRLRLLRTAPQDHVLVATTHHIASDGWSTGIFVREFASRYAAHTTGADSALPELPVQYADFARWERTHVDSAALSAELEYWKRKLAAPLPVLELPGDYPRPPVQSFDGANVRVRIPASAAAGLRALASQEGTSILSVLMGAFAVWLMKHTGQRDVCIGTPVAGRTRLALENVIGFFVNTLVIRSRLEPERKFREVVRDTHATSLEAIANQDVSFERLVDALDPPRDQSRNPLFQTMITYVRNDAATLALPGLTLAAPEWTSGDTAKFDLTAHFLDEPDGLDLVLEYATALFQHRTAERFAARFVALLEAVSADPDAPVAALQALAPGELETLDSWASGPSAEVTHATAHSMFASAVSRFRDREAVECGEETITFGDLDARASRFARHLQGLGVGPGSLVGVCLPRSIDLVVALLGVWQAGGAFIPMDVTYPSDRLAFMVEDAGAGVIVCTSEQFSALGISEGVKRTSPAESSTTPEGSSAVAGGDAVSLAYVAYTSGSTGKPKGAKVTHGGLANYLEWAERAYQIAAGEGAPVHSSIAFDLTITSLWGSLVAGRTALLTREEDGVDGLADALRSGRNFSLVKLTPSHLEVLREQHAARPFTSRVGVFVIGGEQLMYETISYWRSVMPDARFVNEYGPTETVVGCCVEAVTHVRTGGPVPIGRPIANTKLRVLDTRGGGGLAPIGVPGELFIGGAGVALGYHRRPELTAERFVEDRNDPGERWYRTGDLVRYSDDGVLEFIGRTDFQIKLRGHRIELGEIESAVLDDATVAQAVVLLREDVAGDQRLVAYVVPSPHASPDEAGVRARLRTRLPEYMVPAHVVFMDALPLAPTGKVDRDALLAVAHARSEPEASVPPETPRELALERMWCDLLGVAHAGRHDNFFELGGHSLLAVKLVERLRSEGVALDVRGVFLHPTLSSLAAHIDAPGDAHPQGWRVVTVPPPRIPAGATVITPDMLSLITLTQSEIDRIVAAVPGGATNVKDIFPLTTQQEGILFHRLVEGGAAPDTYQQRSVLAADSRANADRLLAALQLAIEHHDALRTAVLWEGLPQAVQVVVRRATMEISEVSVRQGETAEATLLGVTDARALRLDLARPPAVRAFIAEGEDGCRVAIVFHHLFIDHVSLEVLLRGVTADLAGRSVGGVPAPSYREFVGAMLGVPMAEHEAHFRALLGDVDEPTVMFGIRDVRAGMENLAEAHVALSYALSRRIRMAAASRAVTPAVVFHLAWALVVARTSGRDDVVFGTVLLGRSLDIPGVDRMVGMLINSLPVRIRLRDVTVREAVHRTYEQLAALLPHEQAPLVMAQRCSAVAPNTPLFTSLFNYRQNAPSGGEALAGFRSTLTEERTNYPFTVNIDDGGEALGITVQCVQGVDAARLAGYVATAVEGITVALESAPDTSAADIDVMPAAERAELDRWNDTSRPMPAACIHELIAAQVDRFPARTAVSLKDVRLTYRELDARANRIANLLLARGVGRGALVAVCMERSTDLVAALLGILKSGAGYVPLDPSHPPARLKFVLDDAEVAAVLTQDWLRNQLPETAAAVIAIDGTTEALDEQPAIRPAASVLATDRAYVIYTSGSTGQPKGVVVPHGALVNVLESMRQQPGLGEDDVLAAVTTIAFDIAGLELFLPLLAGARVELVAREDSADARALANRLTACGATIMQATPATWRMLVDYGWKGASPFRALVGGEALPPDLAEILLTRAAEVWNLYGPTETTIWSTADRVLPASPVTIGRPIANTRLYVVDGSGHRVPIGVLGELIISGAGVTDGYHKRPELTAEKFVVDAFSVDGGRAFRTGDLVLWRSDGRMEHHGRSDFQVKIRGYRIELGEIESVLSAQPGIREAVVTVRADRSGDAVLVAYVTTEGWSDGQESLREALREQLPAYMIPSAIVELDRLPLSPNGKVDRRALPSPDPNETRSSKQYVAPRTDTERRLAEQWQSFLGVELVGVNDDFFELGGHSITATRAAGWIREAFGVEFPVYAIFEAPTVSAIGARLDTALREAAVKAAEPPREEIEL
jgi:amino acid adenylation domain-containing protein